MDPGFRRDDGEGIGNGNSETSYSPIDPSTVMAGLVPAIHGLLSFPWLRSPRLASRLPSPYIGAGLETAI
jgi:hypothetical protein